MAMHPLDSWLFRLKRKGRGAPPYRTETVRDAAVLRESSKELVKQRLPTLDDIKHDDLIVCASTACLRARLRTEPRPSGSACAITYDALFRTLAPQSGQ
ncbi:hypothetical protein SBA4_6330016 [Candidatus Sulfopaludibacter sp. SbA4]|nr:hypothetical protein SBA4_6330016 [Candidatus Sulfopaludibacter sp. SbA4]